tara:strand:+ start:2940 stop:3311 length:372 start_codon:yes stop_codon:yes gene_type:complete
MNFWFLIFGATIALVGMVFHGYVGQKKYMGNINQGELENLTKSLSLVSWHMFTIFLFVSAISLIFVAFLPVYKIAVYPLILANFLGALLFVLLGIGKHKVLLILPGAYLMSLTALFGLLGVYL